MKTFKVLVTRIVEETIEVEVEVKETGTTEEDLFEMECSAEDLAKDKTSEIDLSEWSIAVTDVYAEVIK